MEQTGTINIHVKIDKKDSSNLYHSTMKIDDTTVEEDVSFPFGTVELLQPIYALENKGLVDYVNPFRLGEQLYNLLFPAELAKCFEGTIEKSRVGEHIRIIIDSDHGEILSLPWELIMHPTMGYLCLSNNISLVRTLGKEFRQSQHTLEAPPLRILMMVASPDDQPKLDYEKEQDVLQNALEKPVRDGLIEIEYCEEGTLDALEREIKADRYQVIHLSGHGGKGSFVFEDDSYRSDFVDSDRLLETLKGSDSIKLVVLSGCLTSKTDHSALSGMAQALCNKGIPLVIGFQMSVPDLVATDLMRQLYQRLCQGWELDNALTDGRIGVNRLVTEDKTLPKDAIMQVSWALPTLYASSSLQRIVDFSKEPVKRAEPKVDFSTKFGEIQYLKTGFVGRRKDIRECREILEKHPCLYIHGFGGIGKSTLSTKLAERYASEGFNGLFIKGKVRVEAIISQIASDLLNENQLEPYRILTSPDVSEEDKLKYCLSIFGRRPYLMIMDNFEDNQKDDLSIDGSLEEGLASLLNGIKNTPTRMIITSRYELKSQRLRTFMGEHNLGEFSFSDAVKKMNRYDCLRIQPPNIKSGIYHRLGGHPKAIEDISAVLDKTPVKWEELDTKLKGVEDKLQADFLLLEVLYDYLDDKQKELLRRSSVYTKPVSCNGLQMQVDDDIEGLIPPLIERSLLQRGYDEDDKVYYVHRITAQFLKDKMSDTEWKDANKSSAEYYDYEIKNNHRDAWDYLTAREHYLICGDLKSAADIATGFTEILCRWGNYGLAMQLNQETLLNSPDKRTKAVAYHNIGNIHQSQGRYEDALKYYNDSLKIEQELGNRSGIALSYNNIGIIHQYQGRYDDALRYYNDSLKIEQELGNRSGIAGSLHQIGWIHQDQGRYEDALKYCNDSLKILQELGDRSGIASSFGQIGNIHCLQSRYDDALKYYNDSLKIRQKLGDRSGIAISLHSIGNIHQYQGRYEDALKYYNDSLKIAQELGDRSGIARSLHNIGVIHQHQDRYEDALKYYNDSLKIAQELGDRSGIAGSLNNIGIIHAQQGRYEDALKYYNDSLKIKQELGDRSGIAGSFEHMGILYFALNKDETAIKYLSRAFIIFQSLSSPSMELAGSYLNQIRQRIGEKKFNKIIQSEMEKIEKYGPFVIPEDDH